LNIGIIVVAAFLLLFEYLLNNAEYVMPRETASVNVGEDKSGAYVFNQAIPPAENRSAVEKAGFEGHPF
jgi:hypothetical protein